MQTGRPKQPFDVNRRRAEAVRRDAALPALCGHARGILRVAATAGECASEAGPGSPRGRACDLRGQWRDLRSATAWLPLAAALAILVADLSGLSKAEVERIWLPYGIWLLVATAWLPAAHRRWWLATQALTALAVTHLLLIG